MCVGRGRILSDFGAFSYFKFTIVVFKNLTIHFRNCIQNFKTLSRHFLGQFYHQYPFSSCGEYSNVLAFCCRQCYLKFYFEVRLTGHFFHSLSQWTVVECHLPSTNATLCSLTPSCGSGSSVSPLSAVP
jgi:hypothetical protein